MNLTTNFKLNEFTRSETGKRLDINNEPDEASLYNLRRLATELEKVRKILGKPIIITSGFRSLALNRKIGSKDNSSHVVGCAADFFVHGYEVKEVVQIIKDSYIRPDQCIAEFDDWIHFSISKKSGEEPREMYLTIDKLGTREFSIA